MIDSALSGREALDLAEHEKYDVIFIDHMMPDMDGIETLQHLRRSGLNQDTPAVALTANAVSGARQMYLDAGFTNYLSKPVVSADLEKMLYALIPEDKLKDPTEDVISETGHEGSSVESEFIRKLSEVPDLDEESGLLYCGSEEGYMSVLTVFHQTADEKSREIESLFEKEDIENYTIKVHALKSSARIIGASELSVLAKELEDAGKEGNRDFIVKRNADLLTMYRALDEALALVFEKDEDLPDISAGALEDAYRTIGEIADSMDYQLMDEILGSLKQYDLPAGHADMIRSIEGMLTRLDWDGIAAAAKEGLDIITKA
jgi:CheY-like chemotaxis protein